MRHNGFLLAGLLLLSSAAVSLEPPPPPADAAACLDAAAGRLDRGENRAAADLLEGCRSRFPSEDRLRLWEARASFLAGDLSRAEVLTAGLLSDPLDLLTRAQVSLAAGRDAEAADLFDAFAASSPWRALGFFLEGEAQEGAGLPDAAEASYRRVLKEDPSFVEIRPSLARLAEGRGDGDEAWRQWDRLLAVDPGNPAARAASARLKPLLTKTPEEIVPSHRIPVPSGVALSTEAWTGPVLRVGLAVDGRGRPQPLKKAAFRTSAPFVLVDGAGKTLAEGAASERWTVRVESGAAVVSDSSGTVRARFTGAAAVRMGAPEKDTVIVEALSFAEGFSWAGVTDKEVRGTLEIAYRPERGVLRLVARIPLEAYLDGVVGAEMPSRWPGEALKVQSVVARTYALARRSSHPHARDGFDLCDEQHCQVYSGARGETAQVRAAVDATRGKVLLYRGKPAYTAYASNCGGRGRSAREAGWGGAPYLPGVFDGKEGEFPAAPGAFRDWLMNAAPVFCSSSTYVPACHSRWVRVVSAADLAVAVRRKKDVGPLRAVGIVARDKGGRATLLRVAGDRGEVLLSSESFARQLLGGGTLRSSLYALEVQERDGRPARVFVYGGGWGHGVGLCQGGAAGRAEAGQDYADILSHYFPGTELGEVPSAGGKKPPAGAAEKQK